MLKLVLVLVIMQWNVYINIIKYLEPFLSTNRGQERFISFSFMLPFTEMSPFVLEKDWSFLFLLINTYWESFEGQMICHCRVLTLVDGDDFWFRRTLNSRFILGEHGGAPNRKGTTFGQFLWGLVWERWKMTILFMTCMTWKMWIPLTEEGMGFPGGTNGEELACQCR